MHKREFAKTHDLVALLSLCCEIEPSLVRFNDAAGRLTLYAVRYRYPGPTDPTEGQVRTVLAEAAEILDWVSREVEAE